jgi:hypothetical protein
MTPTDASPSAYVVVQTGSTIWPGGSHPGLAGRFLADIDGGPKVAITPGGMTHTVAEGHHVVTRWQWTIWGPKYPVSTQIDVSAGQTVRLALDRYRGVSPGVSLAGGVFGLAGGVVMGALQSGGQAGDRPDGDYLDVVP